MTKEAGTDDAPTSVTASINMALLVWSKTALYPWQHEAFRRILKQGGLSGQDKVEIFERARIDHGLTPETPALPSLTLTDADLPSGDTKASRVWLNAVKDLENVNALKAKQRLVVGGQLTLVYGENGSGKSGYTRILKKTARCTAKAVESILPDVFAGAAGPARVVFEIDKGNGPIDYPWQDGEAGPKELQQFAVFDSKCARHFLSDSNQLTFAPFVFEALRLLGEATDAVKQRFLTEAKQLTPPSPSAIQFMVDATSVGMALAEVTANTDAETIRSLARWEERDSASLEAKELQLASIRAHSPQVMRDAIGREARDARSLLANIQAVAAGLAEGAVLELQQQVAEVRTSEEAYRAAVQLALGDARLEGVGSDAWKSLIEAAAKFSTTEVYKTEPFPAAAEDALCVLCHQPLDSAAVSRLKGFWAFLQSNAATRRDAANEALATMLESLKSVPRQVPSEVEALREEYERNHPALWAKVQEFFRSAELRLSAISAALVGASWGDIPALDAEAVTLINELVAALDERLRVVPDDVNAQSVVAALTTEIAELKARRQLSANLQLVLDHIEALRSAARAQKAGNEISTNAISHKAKDLHAVHVTDAFKARVKKYMATLALHRPRVAIGEKSEKGKVLHSIAVDGAKLPVVAESIFSEGERTAISLAFFLADLGSVENTSGVIFDDPVTSLDHRVRSGVVEALVAEAKQRQVIVFTHDLTFYCELFSAATVAQVGVTSNHVEAFSATVGHLSVAEPRESQKVMQRYGELESLIKEAEAADTPVSHDRAVDRFYSQLRAAWERSVEELLFNQVVARYQKEVKTMRLGGVVVDKEAVEAVFRGMTRGSSLTDAHDHAVGAALPTPTVDELRKSLNELKDFVVAQMSKRKAAEKANEHLKG